MANATPVRFGQINSSGAVDAIFLKVFGGEVISAFEENNVMMSRTWVRTIASGKSAAFPLTFKASAAYHVVGAELNGASQPVTAEKVINIDDQLISDVFIANLDEAKSHYDVRGTFSTEQGRALAYGADKRLLQTAVLAARSATLITGSGAGTVLTNAGFGTTGSTLAAGIFSAAQAMDENFVTPNDRYVAVRPAQYYLLAQTTVLLDTDWGGRGSYADATVPTVAGMEVVKTMHLPITNISPVTGEQNTYSGNFSTTVGVCWQKQAIGTVKLHDLSLESQYQIQRQGTLMVAKYIMGHGFLRPECCVELKTA